MKSSRIKTVLSLAVVAMASLFVAGASADAAIIVSESFGGDGTARLAGTSADTFAITAAGASATWQVASADKRNDDGTSLAGDSTSYLALGSHINDAKGTLNGLFTLSATLSHTNGWIALAFFDDTPTANLTITDKFAAMMLMKSGGELQSLRGPGKVAVDVTSSSSSLVTMELDLTPAAYDIGNSKYGTVTYYNGTTATTPLASYTWTVDMPFVGIGMTDYKGYGTISDLTLTQTPEPATMCLLAIGGLGVLMKRRRRA